MGDKDTIPALERAVEVVEAIAGGMNRHAIAELSRRLDIPATTCYRIVRTLIDADWLRPRGQGAGYELSYGLLPLLRPFESHRVLIHAVEPIVAGLVQTTGLSAKVSVISGDRAVTVHRTNCDQPIVLSGRVGMGFHLAHGSSGSALLSRLPDERIDRIIQSAPASVWTHQQPDDVHRRIAHCREHGWCLDQGGYQPQIHTISGPVGDAWGNIGAALTLLGMPGDLDPPHRESMLEAFNDALQRCKQAMGADKETHS